MLAVSAAVYSTYSLQIYIHMTYMAAALLMVPSPGRHSQALLQPCKAASMPICRIMTTALRDSHKRHEVSAAEYAVLSDEPASLISMVLQRKQRQLLWNNNSAPCGYINSRIFGRHFHRQQIFAIFGSVASRTGISTWQLPKCAAHTTLLSASLERYQLQRPISGWNCTSGELPIRQGQFRLDSSEMRRHLE